MNQSQGSDSFSWSEWMESAAKLWASAAQNWQELSTTPAGSSRAEQYMQASLSFWRAFLLPWTGLQFEAREWQQKQPSFDMIRSIVQICGSGGISQEIFNWLYDKAKVTDPSFGKFQQETVKAWMAVYERTIQPLLGIPQVGLTRVYQEKIDRLADKFHSYQAAATEFQTLLSGPMEKSFADMREELDKLRQKGEQVEDSKAYYATWIKVLENHYMSLLKSEEYQLALSRLLNETAAFRMTGNDVFSELLEFLPISTNREMDELYRELYALKKQTKEAIKKINRMESALAKKDIL